MWAKIKAFINMDVENENEVKMYAVILRLILITFAGYSMLSVIFGFVLHQELISAFNIICLVFSALFFYQTYHNMARIATFGTWLMFCGLMVVHTILFGNNTGVYQVVYVLIIMLFTMDYLNRPIYKIALMLLAFAVRIVLFTVYNKTAPFYPAGVNNTGHWQALHMLAFSLMTLFSVIVSTADFTEMRKKLTNTNERFRDMAGKDPLTGLYNRRSTHLYFEEQWDRYKKGEVKSITLVMADIDHFKKVNDTYGHDNGDIVLTTIANTLGKFMRGKGIPSRWGGEEFVLIYVNHNGDEVYTDLFELQKEISALKFNFNGEEIGVTLTFGVAEQGADADVEATIKEADSKLYLGKEKGRNVIIY